MSVPYDSAERLDDRSDRDKLLARVRAALAVPEGRIPDRPPPAVDESLMRLCKQQEDLTARFVQEARSAGMHVHRVAENQLADCVRSLLVEHACRTAALSIVDPVLREKLTTIAGQAGCEVVDWRSQPGFEGHYDADVGITDVDAALAESGTIIISSGPERSRATHLLPPVHIAVLLEADILADAIDYWDRPGDDHPGSRAAATTFITGPSKTADIEGIIITGVHGPGEVHIVLAGPSGPVPQSEGGPVSVYRPSP